MTAIQFLKSKGEKELSKIPFIDLVKYMEQYAKIKQKETFKNTVELAVSEYFNDDNAYMDVDVLLRNLRMEDIE